MKTRSAVLAAAAFVAVSPFPAQQAPGAESEVESVVRAVYKALAHSEFSKLARLLSSDADLWVGGSVIGRGPAAIHAALQKRPAWSEVTPPQVEHLSTRFLSPDVAVVDAEQHQYGSIVVKASTPVTIMLQRRGTAWRVVSLRLFPRCAVGGPVGSHCR